MTNVCVWKIEERRDGEREREREWEGVSPIVHLKYVGSPIEISQCSVSRLLASSEVMKHFGLQT